MTTTTIPAPPPGLSAAAESIWEQAHDLVELDDAGRSLLHSTLLAYDAQARLGEELRGKPAAVSTPWGVRIVPKLRQRLRAQTTFVRGMRDLGLRDLVPGGLLPVLGA